MKFLFFFILIGTVSYSFSQTSGNEYTVPGVDTIIAKHKIFAILPFNYKVEIKKLPKGMTVDDIRKGEIKSSLACQNSMYEFALEKKGQRKLSVEIQEINTTNEILEKDGFVNVEFDSLPPEKLCKMLKVDAVLQGIVTSSHMSAAAVATSVLLLFGNTHHSKVTFKLYNHDGILLWNYSKDVHGGLASDDNDLIRDLMKKSVRKFPYSTTKK